MSHRDVIVADFDGTICRLNSFHLWILCFLFFGWLVDGSSWLSRLYKAINCIRLRFRKNITHDEFKKSIQVLIAPENTGYPESLFNFLFVKLLFSLSRKELVHHLRQSRSQGVECIIATAAPFEYMKSFVDSIDPSAHILATPLGGSDKWYDNRQERKFKVVMSFLSTEGIKGRLQEVHSDHVDDLPLLMNCVVAYLYQPIASDRTACAVLRRNNVRIRRGL